MSKVLILSQAKLESSTDLLCKWLIYYRIPFVRYNGEDLFDLDSLNDMPQNTDYSLVWYRRRISSFPHVNYSFKAQHYNNEFALKKFLADEFKAVYTYLYHRIELKKWVNDPFSLNGINKLHVLQLAAKHNLNVPFTEVVTTRAAVARILRDHSQIIVKPLSELIFLEGEGNTHFKMLTKVIHERNIHYVPVRFFPSLIQECIAKKMEIRAFYLFGKFYSMVIYSQNNNNTEVDFRNYDFVRPNRTVPYQLPKEIEIKLDALMKDLSFNTGSIDLILTPGGDYIFLEINPEGQFGMVSHPCNYYLEREMALVFKEKSAEDL
ncbi:grasp-with-spasm system ATP-grasp peptide maturase [Pedobacter steynii]|uniref:Grasp-with-spasm system ATP-grasp peptide maturase n=1 Tax=Pedobacter steynii TaxID=430522 RepID=A0A1D7QNI9_9SPHI|nr:grasp-with-spasm system ATP-grasp peptide maturase [Pedobacter steynii]AOM80217.1 grasp-with-spasm system ATP-grasp peptide maturase [Pedobacter steynii]